ncbi:TetR/AcrR family transcriptional regulator [Nocardia sp. JMUB6875]|uniref:TetR/AcrR family transcriptional regulator n=1 Tax=Nocardia sp. JMUB6875 TaxID=3158170 RepID=UPI0032E70F97
MVSARREQILDAARDLIVRDGFAAASMHAIARAAGVTRPALYGEFGDRDQLFAALLDREEEKVMELVEASMPEFPPGADPLEFAGRLADVYLELVLSAPQSFRFVLMPPEGAPPGTSERVEQGKAAIRDRSRMLITMAAAVQDREVDAELLSHAALAVSETAARLVLDPGQAGDRDEVSRTLRWLARRVVGGPSVGTTEGRAAGTAGGPIAGSRA